jgi:hypothetical protein
MRERTSLAHSGGAATISGRVRSLDAPSTINGLPGDIDLRRNDGAVLRR